MSKWTNIFIWVLSISIASSKLSAVNQNDLPEPYKSVKLLPYDPQGWYFNAWQIEFVLKNHKVNTVIEVGSWLGQSTRHIASLLPSNGKVYAIDHWKGSVEHQATPGLEMIYEQFLSNVIHAGLTDKIIPIRMSSLEAAEYFRSNSIKADLIYIDASHDTESVLADLNAWFPLVKGHGIICGDDWRIFPTVRRAVEIFAEQNNLHVQASRNFWMLRE